MSKGKKGTLHEALITGTVEELETAAAATGRPIRHVVSHPNGAFATDGMLFSTGRDDEATPQRRLLDALARVYGARLDFDQGTLVIETDEQNLFDSVLHMTNLVTTMLTASPHLPTDIPNQT